MNLTTCTQYSGDVSTAFVAFLCHYSPFSLRIWVQKSGMKLSFDSFSDPPWWIDCLANLRRWSTNWPIYHILSVYIFFITALSLPYAVFTSLMWFSSLIFLLLTVSIPYPHNPHPSSIPFLLGTADTDLPLNQRPPLKVISQLFVDPGQIQSLLQMPSALQKKDLPVPWDLLWLCQSASGDFVWLKTGQ